MCFRVKFLSSENGVFELNLDNLPQYSLRLYCGKSLVVLYNGLRYVNAALVRG